MQPITIAIAGGSASGKTTFANVILERIGAERIAYIPHDSYYRSLRDLPDELREPPNFDHPDSLETELFMAHIKALQRGEVVEVPIYDFATHSRTDRVRVITPRPAILVEGILIFTDSRLRSLFDVMVYVDPDPDIRFIRRLKRDIEERGRTVESVVGQWLATVRPMHLEFVEPSKRYAHIIVPEGGLNEVAMDMIVTRIKALLEQR
jgi:uridine kinase